MGILRGPEKKRVRIVRVVPYEFIQFWEGRFYFLLILQTTDDFEQFTVGFRWLGDFLGLPVSSGGSETPLILSVLV